MRIAKDTHVSVGVCLLKGENDESLKWPLNSEICIQLLNWREDKGHVEMIIPLPIAAGTRVMDGERAPDCCIKPEFIPHKDLKYNVDSNIEYLRHDKLCFRVSKVSTDTGNKTYCTLYNKYTYRPFVI